MSVLIAHHDNVFPIYTFTSMLVTSPCSLGLNRQRVTKTNDIKKILNCKFRLEQNHTYLNEDECRVM